MNKKELITKIVAVLKENDARKKVNAHSNVLHISDDNGNHTDFTVRRSERSLLYNGDDVEHVIDALLAVVLDAVKSGEPIDIRGYGYLGMVKRVGREIIHPLTREHVVTKTHYTPKLTIGSKLRTAARVYEQSLDDNNVDDIPYYDIGDE